MTTTTPDWLTALADGMPRHVLAWEDPPPIDFEVTLRVRHGVGTVYVRYVGEDWFA
jgi:hypothetical protein